VTEPCLTLGPLPACVNVLIADDIVFAEVGSCLHLNQFHCDLAWVFHAVHRAKRDLDRLVFGHQFHLVIHRHPRRARHHDPVFGTVNVALQAQRGTGVDDDPLDLKAVP